MFFQHVSIRHLVITTVEICGMPGVNFTHFCYYQLRANPHLDIIVYGLEGSDTLGARVEYTK